MHASAATNLATPPPPRMNNGKYNIRDVRGFGLSQAIWATKLGNYDLFLLKETEIQDTIYCKNRMV